MTTDVFDALGAMRKWLRHNLSEDDAGEAYELLNAVTRCAIELYKENDEAQKRWEWWEHVTKCVDMPEYRIGRFKPKDIVTENARLEAENKGLRTLAETLVRCGEKYRAILGTCPMFASADEGFRRAARIAREYGIEVDDDI